MKVSVVRLADHVFEEAESCLVVPLFEHDLPLRGEVLAQEDELVLQALADKDILDGKAQSCYYLPRPGGAYQGVLTLGLGKEEAFEPETLRRAAGKACGIFGAHRVSRVYLDVTHFSELPAAAFVEGVVLGQYDFDVYRTPPEDAPAPVKVESITVIVADDMDPAPMRRRLQLAALTCMSTNGARHLANTGPNEMTPVALAEFAAGIAEETGCEYDALDPEAMEALGMGALLGVARGSERPARLIVLRHHHADDARTLAILGKGVTFDSGGISIKPSDGMHEMKFDMCGAAAALCTMMNVGHLKPPVNVVCVVPAVENMPSGSAMRPGDVLRACNGKTIEVRNTDAEGRLILADALAYTVKRFQPNAMVDLATLTGACGIALGHYAAGLFTPDDALAEALDRAGVATGERVWRLPLWADYEKLLESKHADLSNIGPRNAGAITAAAFLKNFVGETPWAHIDIAGTAWGGTNLPHLSTDHATGYGVRLLTRWIMDEAKG